MGNRDPDAAPHGVYPCHGEERWIAIACFSDTEWQVLGSVIEKSGQEWAGEDRFSTLPSRKQHEDELEQLMGRWTEGWDSQALMRTLQGQGVAALGPSLARDEAGLAHGQQEPVEEGLGNGTPEVLLGLEARGLDVVAAEDVVVFTLCHGRGV